MRLFPFVLPAILVLGAVAAPAQQVCIATSATTGYYAPQVVAKTSGATDSYVFNGPNTMALTDQVMHGSITMTRVQ